MTDELMRREMMEAIQAGERALNSLKTAQSQLRSAGNWGIFDMFGGGLFSSAVKHSKINDASRCVENAKRDLQIFQRELKDVDVPINLQMGNIFSLLFYICVV